MHEGDYRAHGNSRHDTMHPQSVLITYAGIFAESSVDEVKIFCDVDDSRALSVPSLQLETPRIILFAIAAYNGLAVKASHSL